MVQLSEKFSLLVCLPTAIVTFYLPPSRTFIDALPLSTLFAILLCALFFTIHRDTPPPPPADLPPEPSFEASQQEQQLPPTRSFSVRKQRKFTATAEERVKASLSPDRLEMATRLITKLTATMEYDHALFAPNYVNARRFLQARNWNEAVAEKLWRKAAMWRIDYKLTARRAQLAKLRKAGRGFDCKHDFIEHYWYWYPLCNDGNGVPVVVLGASTADPHGIIQETDNEFGFMDRILDFYEHTLETAIALDVLDFGIVEVFDLREIPLVPNYFSRATNSIWPFKSFAKIADEVYVERMRKCVLIGPPRVFSFIWNAFLPLIPADTKKKIAVLTKQEDWLAELKRQGLSMDHIPANYGGRGTDENIKIGKCVPRGSLQKYMSTEFRACSKPIGLISDVQYADEDDGQNFSGSVKRKYRNSLHVGLKSASQTWKELGVSEVVQLGDLIDGCAKKKSSTVALQQCLQELNQFSKVHHVVGNHEMYNFPDKCALEQVLQSKATYRTCDVQEDAKFRWIFLDAYDTSVLSVEGTVSYNEALQVLLTNHPRDFRKDKDWLKQRYSLERRFVPYNGQVSNNQLVWLREQLDQCVKEDKFALVCTHVAMQPGASAASCLLWNYREVLKVVQQFACSKHKGQRGVVAVFAGHDHCGGFALDETGLAHITLTSPLEAADSVAYSTLQLGREGFWLKAFGTERERIVRFHKSSEEATEAYHEFCEFEINSLHAACEQMQPGSKTWEECEQVWMQHEGNWDELPAGWPRKN